MKVGDKVRVVKGTQLVNHRDDRDIGREGVVVEIDKDDREDMPYLVALPDCAHEPRGSYWYAEDDLEVIE